MADIHFQAVMDYYSTALKMARVLVFTSQPPACFVLFDPREGQKYVYY